MDQIETGFNLLAAFKTIREELIEELGEVDDIVDQWLFRITGGRNQTRREKLTIGDLQRLGSYLEQQCRDFEQVKRDAQRYFDILGYLRDHDWTGETNNLEQALKTALTDAALNDTPRAPRGGRDSGRLFFYRAPGGSGAT
jgi:hypothetical protein